MIKYYKEWSYKEKSGICYYVVVDGVTYKIDKDLFDALPADVLFLGRMNEFTDKEKGKTNIWFSSK